MSDVVVGLDVEGFIVDVIVVGVGLVGLVVVCELVNCGLWVLIFDQENWVNVGGQVFWLFGGLFLVNSFEQCCLGICDSYEFVLQDWLGMVVFDWFEDYWFE